MLPTLDAASVNCIVTSPPYLGLRNYAVDGQIGLEADPQSYVGELVTIFIELKRVLRDDGVVFLNLGDSYNASGREGHGNRVGYKQATNRGSAAGADNTRSNDPDLKEKDLLGIPWRVAFALQADGWYLRSEIIWAKPNAMPGSQQDRVSSSHETIFMLTKSAHYWSDFDAIKTPPRESTAMRLAQDTQEQAGSHRANGGQKTNGPMRAVGSDKQRGHSRVHAGFNERWDSMDKAEQQSRPAMMRDVWFVSPGRYRGQHFAVMPEEIARRCILAGCPVGGTVLDPFFGAGTTGLVADKLGRNCIGIELNPEYSAQASERIKDNGGMFARVE